MASGVAPAINTVDSLLKNPFDGFKFEDKLAIQHLGPDKPDIRFNQQTKD
jgi:aspartyl-tRNA synthetase